jgi:hypothetical protein
LYILVLKKVLPPVVSLVLYGTQGGKYTPGQVSLIVSLIS